MTARERLQNLRGERGRTSEKDFQFSGPGKEDRRKNISALPESTAVLRDGGAPDEALPRRSCEVASGVWL